MRLVVGVVACLMLAGCGGKPAVQPEAVREAEAAALAIPLEPSATTGILRGYVLDSAIRPVEGARIRLEPGNATTTSTAQGAFGLEGLDPGVYFLHVTRAGYLEGVVGAEVQAGQEDPDLVKVFLEAAVGPFVEVLQLRGFLDSSASYGLMGQSNWLFVSRLTSVVTGEEGQFGHTIDIEDPAIQWIQHEMVWEAGSPLGERMGLLCSLVPEDDGDEGLHKEIDGPSPVVHAWNQTELAPLQGAGSSDCLYVSAAPSDPAGVGLSFMQYVDIFTHVFHGYQPPAGWQFSTQGAPPPP